MKVVIFDSETSGLIDNHTLKLDQLPEIIELYAVEVDLESGKRSRELDLLIKPKRPVTEEITRITTITNEMLVSASPFEVVADTISNFIEKSPIVLAHNASYDKEMLDIEFERLGRKLKWPRVICSVECSVFVKGYRLNLGALHELLFGEKFEGAHRARVDVDALTRCCVEMHKKGWL